MTKEEKDKLEIIYKKVFKHYNTLETHFWDNEIIFDILNLIYQLKEGL